MPLPAMPGPCRATACHRTPRAAADGAAAPLDEKQWLKILARYRDPNPMRSLYEVLVTAVPFFVLWAVMLLCLSYGYWLSLIVAVPAAGFLVRLFMIQHDCGHGSFFRSRVANNTLGRMIGVLTLTPYDYWRRTHALHHAGSGNLDRRGKGDVTTLTVAEYLNLPRWRRLAYRLIAQSADPAAARPDLHLPAQASHADRADGWRQGGLDQRHGDQPRHRRDRGRHERSGRRPGLSARAAADHAPRVLDRDLSVLRPAPVRGDLLGPSGGLELPRRRDAGQHPFRSASRRSDGSPPTSASTTSITWRAGSPAIG